MFFPKNRKKNNKFTLLSGTSTLAFDPLHAVSFEGTDFIHPATRAYVAHAEHALVWQGALWTSVCQWISGPMSACGIWIAYWTYISQAKTMPQKHQRVLILSWLHLAHITYSDASCCVSNKKNNKKNAVCKSKWILTGRIQCGIWHTLRDQHIRHVMRAALGAV